MSCTWSNDNDPYTSDLAIAQTMWALDKQTNANLCYFFQMMRSKRRTRNQKRRTKEEKDFPTFSEADDSPEKQTTAPKKDCDWMDEWMEY